MANNALYLPNWTVTDVKVDERYDIEASYDIVPEACPKCGVVGRFVSHGPKETKYVDAPVHGKKTVIHVAVKRFKCRECGETFLQSLPDMAADRRMTLRCYNHIAVQSLIRPTLHIARDVGVDEKTCRNIQREHIAKLLEERDAKEAAERAAREAEEQQREAAARQKEREEQAARQAERDAAAAKEREQQAKIDALEREAAAARTRAEELERRERLAKQQEEARAAEEKARKEQAAADAKAEKERKRQAELQRDRLISEAVTGLEDAAGISTMMAEKVIEAIVDGKVPHVVFGAA